MDSNELPDEINFVRLGRPEMITYKTKTKQSTKPNVRIIKESKLRCNDILDQILPVKEWKNNGQIYRQRISNQPGANNDIRNLGEKLDMYMKKFNGRELGICMIRQQLYYRCFNEIIRQITVNCPLRGSMFIRVRDEHKRNLDQYQKLYESISSYGIRKTLLTEENRTKCMTETEQLMIENKRLEAELEETILKTEQCEREMIEAKKSERARHAKDLDAVKEANESIRIQYETLIDAL